ncbi:hypothetical protein [Acinetobacter guillouiae]|uniref:hypothetical protein n=1 Tax=Acinetobacter guillouiae TaxID=106649 RepID=UPI001CD641D2|nr:hypothetical protein [Acinetobacter guillouiae]
MKIINSIKFVLLLLGIGNLNLSFAQADLQDQALSLPKLYPSVPVHYQSKADLGDQLIAVQWMTEDFSKELKGGVAINCQPFGIQATTKDIVAGSTIPLTLYDPENDNGDEYKLRGTVGADGIARVVFDLCEPEAFHDFITVSNEKAMPSETVESKLVQKNQTQKNQIQIPFSLKPSQLKKAQFNQMNSKKVLENGKTWENEKIKQVGKTEEEKAARKQQRGELDTILDAKWMTVDFSEEIQSAYPCQAIGLLIQTQHIPIGEEVDAVVQWEDDDDKSRSGEYTVYGKVEPDHRVRIIFDQHIDPAKCGKDVESMFDFTKVDQEQAQPETRPASKSQL